MLIENFANKPLLYALGFALSATVLGACAGTSSDTGSDTAVQQAVIQNQVASSDAETSLHVNSKSDHSDADKGIDAVVKFAKEVELDDGGQQDATATSTENAKAEEEQELPQQYVFHFETNSVSLNKDALREIEKHAHFLRAHSNSVVSINGHADIRGSSEYNQTLSLQRAQVVAEKLKQLGVAETQIMVASHGEGAPAVDEGNWGENRRVELDYLDDYMLSTR